MGYVPESPLSKTLELIEIILNELRPQDKITGYDLNFNISKKIGTPYSQIIRVRNLLMKADLMQIHRKIFGTTWEYSITDKGRKFLELRKTLGRLEAWEETMFSEIRKQCDNCGAYPKDIIFDGPMQKKMCKKCYLNARLAQVSSGTQSSSCEKQ